MKNPHLDVDRLSLIAAFLVLLGDIIALLLAFQEFMDKLDNNNNNNNILLLNGVDIPLNSTNRSHQRRKFR